MLIMDFQILLSLYLLEIVCLFIYFDKNQHIHTVIQNYKKKKVAHQKFKI